MSTRFTTRAARVGSVCTALVLATTACGGGADADAGATAAGGDAPSEYVVGLITEQTGPAAAVGAVFERAQTLYFELNPEIDGVPVRLVTCDDASAPEQAANCARQLNQEEKAHVILGPNISGPHRGAFPLLAKGNAIALSGSPYAQTDPETPVFSASNRSAAIPQESFQFAADQGWDKIGIIATTDVTGEAGVTESEAPAKEFGLELKVERMDPTDTSATAQLSSLRDWEPDAIAVWMSGASVGVTFKALAQLNMADVPVFLIWSSLTEGFMKAVAADLPANTYVAAGANALAENRDDAERAAEIDEFSDAYEAEYGNVPDFVSLAAFDSAKLAAETLASSKGDKDAGIAYLEGLQEHDLLAWTVSYSDSDHTGGTGGDDSYRVYKVEPGGALSNAS
jgi:branched-chain amino acid transport system substrate-binding protein